MKRRTGALLYCAALAGALGGIVPAAALAFTVQVKNVADDQETTDLAFGDIDSSISHHSANQYLAIEQTNLTNRTISIFTNNGAVLGISKPGLVAGDGSSVPLYFRVYDDKPVSGDFLVGDQGLWTALLEASDPAFATSKATGAYVPPGPDGITAVFLGALLATSTVAGGYGAKLVIEEYSPVDDVTGPVVLHEAFNDIILLGIPVGIEATINDDSLVAGSTLYFRLHGDVAYSSAPTTWTQDPVGLSWTAVGVLEPGALPAGRILEYYFTAVDQYGNTGQSEGGSANPFRANLTAATQVVERDIPVNGGVVKFAVGDPRLPWLEVSFPPGSLSSEQTMGVSLESADAVAPFQGRAPARAYEFTPEGLRFSRPVTLDLPYSDMDPEDGMVDGTDIREADLRVFWWDGFAWRFVGGQVDPEANRVRVNASHFGLFGLFPMGTLTADMVRPLEKIITPNGDGKNDTAKFSLDPLDGGFDIEIFDIRSAVVRRISNVPEWDGRNDDGEVVESGTYVYRLEGQGMTVTGMIAVAR